jgi:hypothetical protein
MAMGFDQLMKYLLEEIALNGEAGMLVFLFSCNSKFEGFSGRMV